MSEPVLGSGTDGAPMRDGAAVPVPRPTPGPRAVPGPTPSAPGSGLTSSAASGADRASPSEEHIGAGPDAGPVTGDAAVDEALRTLRGVEDRDLRSQVAAFEDVHRALQDRLADAEG